jgi:hypothetical protein
MESLRLLTLLKYRCNLNSFAPAIFFLKRDVQSVRCNMSSNMSVSSVVYHNVSNLYETASLISNG